MADQDPIEIELNWNSKEFMAEFQKFLSDSETADKKLQELQSKFDKITKEQQNAAKNFQGINQSIKDIGTSAKKSDKDFDSFGLDQENIEIQKQVIKELESEMKNLYKQIDKTAPGKAQASLLQEAREIEKELEQEKKALGDVEIAYKENKEAVSRLSAEYDKSLARLKELALAKQQDSEEYKQLLASCQQYRDALQGLNDDLSGNGQSSIGNFVGLLTLMSSGLSTAEGTMGLFAGENENLDRIMVKLQSVMAVTIGLQEINDTLNDRNAASTRALIAVKNLWVAVNARVTASLVAMGVAEATATIAAQVLIGTLTLGLSVAIGAIIVWFDKWQEEQKEATEAQQKLTAAVADSAADQMIAYKKLQVQWNSLGDDLKSKTKFINGNQDAFKKLGVEVNNVADAENILVKNTGAFVESMMARAEATASMQLAQEKFKEYLVKRNEENEKLSDPTIGQNIGQWWQMGVRGKSTEDFINEAHEESEALKKEYEDFIGKAVDFEKRKDEIYKKYGFKEYLGKEKKPKKEKKERELAEVFDEGSVLKLQQQIMLLDGALQRMGKNGEVRIRALDKYGQQYATKEVVNLQTAMDRRAVLLDELAEAEKKIRIMKLSETISEMEEEWKKFFQYEKLYGLDAAKQQFPDLQKEGMGMSFYDYLGIEKDKLQKITDGGGILTDEQKKGLELILDKMKELTGQKNDFQIFSETTEAQLQQIPTIGDQIDYLIKQRDKLTSKEVDQGFYAFLDTNIDEKRRELKSMVVEFVKSHQDFEVQRTAISSKYASIRANVENKTNISETNRSAILKNLELELNEELSAVTTAQYQRQHLESELGANLIGITTRQLQARIQTLKEFLDTEVSLTKEQKDKLTNELQKAQGFLNNAESTRQENVLNDKKAQILKDINSLKSKGNNLTVIENNLILNLLDELGFVNEKLKDINLEKYQKIADWSSEVAGSFAELSEAIGDSNSALTVTLQTISELGKDVGSVIGAFQKGLVEGIVSLVATVIKWVAKLFTMGKRARESERQAQEELQKYSDSILQSQLDYNAELRKRISQEIKLNDLYKSRVDNIKEEMAANSKNKEQIIKDQQEVFNRLLNAQTVVGMHTEKYGGFLGMGRKTRTVEEYKTIAELLGIGSSSPLGGGVWSGIQIFQPGTAELTDEIFDKLEKLNAQNPFTGAAKTAFEQLKKLRDEYGSIEELNRQLEIELKNTVTGTTAQALADSIRDGLKSGKKSFADFANDIEGFLREAILSGISAKMIEPKIQELQDALAEMMGDGILSQDERNKFQEMYMAIVKQSQDYMDIINQSGVDLTNTTNNANSLKGALSSMSQESADIMSGQLGGLRLAQLETNQILKSSTTQQLTHLSKMVELQVDIEKNTRKTAENTGKIQEVNTKGFGKVVEGQEKYYQALQAAGIIT